IASRTVSMVGGWEKGQATMPRASGTSGRRRRAGSLRVATLPDDPAVDLDVLVGDELDSRERFLAAALFTDFAPATDPYPRSDEQAWPQPAAESSSVVGRQAARYEGRLGACDAGGFVRFSGAYSAIRCALAIRRDLHEIGVDLCAGLHAAEGSVHDTRL